MQATIKAVFNDIKKKQTDPIYALKHHVKSCDSRSDFQPVTQPMECMSVDPVMDQIKAELAYNSYQVSSGFEVYKSGMIESAADEQNLRAYQDANNMHAQDPNPHTDYADPYCQPSHFGKPGPMSDPFTCPQPMAGLGGY